MNYTLSSLNYLDELVKEYLVFRGFTQSQHYFSLEKKSDKLKGFQVEKILEQINFYISTYDIQHLIELWNFLDVTFFSRIDYNNHFGSLKSNSSSGVQQSQQSQNNRAFRHDITTTIKKLSSSLKKYYIIYAINNNKNDKVKEFFDLYSQDLQKDPEWKNWFVIPYIKNPQTDPMFEVYFSKGWSEAFSLSLRNFLATIFKNMPLPRILQFNLERQNRKRLEAQVESLLSQNEELRSQVDKLEYQSKREQQQLAEKEKLKSPTQTSSTTTEFEKIENPSFSRFNRRSDSKNNLTYNGYDDEESKVVIGSGRSRKSIQPNTFQAGSLASSGYEMTEINDQPISQQHQQQQKEPQTLNSQLPQQPQQSINNSSSIGANTSLTNLNNVKSNNSNNNNQMSSSLGILKGSGSSSGGENTYIIDSQENLTSHTTPITRVKFLSNGSKIASSSIDGTVRLWNVDGFSRTTTIYCLSEVLALEWEARAKLLLCGTSDSKIKIWNSSTDKAVGDINTPQEFQRVEDISCNPTGNSFASSHNNAQRSDGVVYTWNLRTLKYEDKISTSNSIVNSMTYNNTGSLLATGCVDGTIRIFNIKSCQSIAGWQADQSEIISVQFNSDDNKLYSLSKDGKLSRWDIHAMGRPEKEYEYPGFPSEPHRTTKIAFNQDGGSFAIGSNNKYSLIYNIENPNPILQISGHSGPVVSVDWHPTQNIIVSGSLDQNVRLAKLTKIYSSVL